MNSKVLSTKLVATMVFKQIRLCLPIGIIFAFSLSQASQYVLVDGLATLLPSQARRPSFFFGQKHFGSNSRQALSYHKISSFALRSSRKNTIDKKIRDVEEVSNRTSSRRWNGNYKHASKRLSDITKAKKLKIDLSITDSRGNVVTKRVEKKRQETVQHVLTKAIIWKLYCDKYPNIEIELDIGDPNYLPDVVAMADPIPAFTANGDMTISSPAQDKLSMQSSLMQPPVPAQVPIFWGESGRMKVHKAVDLMRRYPDTHIVHCRWGVDIDHFANPLLDHLQMLYDTDTLGDLPHRKGGFTFCSLPLEVWQFIDEETRMIEVSEDDLQWKELKFPTESSM